jgi:Ca-activated chloride channel homolog
LPARDRPSKAIARSFACLRWTGLGPAPLLGLGRVASKTGWTGRAFQPAMRLVLISSLALGVAVVAGACGGTTGKLTAEPLVQARDPGLIALVAEPSASLVNAGKPGRLALRVRVTAAELPGEARPPLNLALVIDTSGSMEGAAIEEARRSAETIVARLRDGDRIALIAFGSTAEVLFPSTVVDARVRGAVRRRIAAMEARGTTDLASGLAHGLAQLGGGRTPETLNRLVLLSDGVPNDAAAIPSLVQQAQGGQIAISALGLGVDFDETLLGSLAAGTGGSYRYAATPDAMAELFDREVLRLQRLVGRNLYLTLTPGPGVVFEDIPGFALGAGPGPRTIMLGDLSSGERRDVIVPLTVAGRQDGAIVELIDAVLQFDDVAGGSGPQRRDAFVKVGADADAARVTASIQLDLHLAAVRAEAAGAMLQAIATARAGDPATARAMLIEAEQRARAAAVKHKDAELAELADRMAELAPTLASLAPQHQIPVPTAAYGSPGIDAPSAAPEPMSRGSAESVKASHNKASSLLRGW